MDNPAYSMCYDPATWASCPALPPCLDSNLDLDLFLGNRLLTEFGWSMARIIQQFDLPTLQPNVAWDSLDFQGMTPQQIISYLDLELYVSLDTIPLRASSDGLCDELYDSPDGAFFHSGQYAYWSPTDATTDLTPDDIFLAFSFYRPSGSTDYHLYPYIIRSMLEDPTSF